MASPYSTGQMFYVDNGRVILKRSWDDGSGQSWDTFDDWGAVPEGMSYENGAVVDPYTDWWGKSKKPSASNPNPQVKPQVKYGGSDPRAIADEGKQAKYTGAMGDADYLQNKSTKDDWKAEPGWGTGAYADQGTKGKYGLPQTPGTGQVYGYITNEEAARQAPQSGATPAMATSDQGTTPGVPSNPPPQVYSNFGGGQPAPTQQPQVGGGTAFQNAQNRARQGGMEGTLANMALYDYFNPQFAFQNALIDTGLNPFKSNPFIGMLSRSAQGLANAFLMSMVGKGPGSVEGSYGRFGDFLQNAISQGNVFSLLGNAAGQLPGVVDTIRRQQDSLAAGMTLDQVSPFSAALADQLGGGFGQGLGNLFLSLYGPTMNPRMASSYNNALTGVIGAGTRAFAADPLDPKNDIFKFILGY